jgi:hypothetical protein
MGNPRIALKVRILPDLAVAGSHRQGPVRGMGDGTAGVDQQVAFEWVVAAAFEPASLGVDFE